MKPQTAHTICGLPARKRDRGGDEIHPPARVLREPPPTALCRSCPRCVAEANASKMKGEGGEGAGSG